MGMDVFRFEVIRALTNAEAQAHLKSEEYNEDIQSLDMSPRLAEWMVKNNIGPEFIFKSQDYDWEAWFEKNPQYKDWHFADYDLHEESNPRWLQLESPDGKTVLIDDGFIMKNTEYLFVETKEIGYMRKPFRHSETPNRVEGDTLVLTVTNFSDKGKDGYEQLKKIDPKQTEEANVEIFNLEQVESLKSYTCDEEYFEQMFMKDWKPNHYVLFNW
jgi:hypothetical protein